MKGVKTSFDRLVWGGFYYSSFPINSMFSSTLEYQE